MWAGIEAADAKPSQAVGVLGIGGLGSLAVQFYKARGHPVVAIDNRHEGRALAQEPDLKADLVIDMGDSNAVEKIKAWAGQLGLAAIVVCTDSVSAIEWSTKVLRPHGVCVPLGLPVEALKFNAFDVIFQELSIKGSLVASISQVEDMMKTVAKHGVRSHVSTIPLEKVPDLPGMYLDPHLTGRLVMKISS